MYRIFQTAPFQKILDSLDPSVGQRIEKKLKGFVFSQLQAEPHVGPNIKKLMGWKPQAWRYRIGSWRVFYEIDESDEVVLLTGLADRKDAY